jgi:CO/xanthine dehydrogenase FAD-binding subunit
MPSPNPITAQPDLRPRSQIEARQARTLAEALTIMAEGVAQGRPWTVVAGGTDLMVLLNQRKAAPARVLDLWPVEGLRGISETEGAVSFGALTTYTALRQSEAVRAYHPSLAELARWCGAAQIQNRGTVGGNIAGGSPAGDSLPFWAAWDASLTLVSARGTRVVEFADFYTGYRRTVLEPDELILRVSVPKPSPDERQSFDKVGTRQAQSISKLMLATRGRLDPSGRVLSWAAAMGSVAPTVLRLRQTEAVVVGHVLDDALIERARAEAEAEVQPIDDVRSTGQYRRRVAGNLIVRRLRALMHPPAMTT